MPGRVARDHDGHAVVRDAIQKPGELQRQVYAAMAFRVARKTAGMQGDTVPSQALHIEHRRIVVFGRSAVRILLQNAEHAGRSLMTRPAGRDGCHANPNAVAIDRGTLIGQVHINQDRSGWRDLRRQTH